MIPGIPQNINLSQTDAKISISWSGQAGATSYSLQRSTDGVNYTTLASPTNTQYTDLTVTVGNYYWYQVASTNGSGTSPYNSVGPAVPAPNGELSLGELRLRAQQRADRVNSQFVTQTEWNYFLNQAMTELYDLLINVHEDYFAAPRMSFTLTGQTDLYPLPNGVIQMTNDQGQTVTAPPFYKLLGLDLSLNTAQNAYVTIHKFDFIDRNRYVYPNTASTLYGVFNMRYRMMGPNIQFMPTPSSAGQYIRMNYIPRLPELALDNDITIIGYSGWLQYVIIRAAKYALDKEESPTDTLDQELIFLQKRIEETAINRDVGQPDTISDIRAGTWSNGGWGYGSDGPSGGY